MRARRRASVSGRPERIRSRVRASTWKAISSAISVSKRDEGGRNGMRISCLLRPRAKCRGHPGHDAVPAFGFVAEALAAGRRQLGVLGAAIILRNVPLGLAPALALQAGKRGIERALLDEECAARNLLDAQQHAVAVEPAQGYGLED